MVKGETDGGRRMQLLIRLILHFGKHKDTHTKIADFGQDTHTKDGAGQGRAFQESCRKVSGELQESSLYSAVLRKK